MSNLLLKAKVEDVTFFLEVTVNKLEGFLNTITIDQLLTESRGDRAYYEGLLSNLRRLLVFCEEGLDSCLLVTHNERFVHSKAKKTLHRIYHSCVKEYFTPRYDLWFEDKRLIVPQSSSIRFRQEPPKRIVQLMKDLEIDFYSVREELESFDEVSI